MEKFFSFKTAATGLFLLAIATTAFAGGTGNGATDLSSFKWFEVNANAVWAPRAGLQVIDHNGDFYLMGGRTPRPPVFPPIPGDSDIWGDVWKSGDRGASWARILETDDSNHWPARAYFRALKKGPYMYVLGGQNFRLVPNPDPSGPPFISTSDFFSDVWRSRDGVTWTPMTDDAGWHGRAGLSAVVFKGRIFVMGGSFNDDPAVIGGPPTRVYFNDVWSSRDGKHWTQETANAPWAPRAGAIVVVKDGYMYLLGGEDGFLCMPGSGCPYYNDVWRTKDGASWELVTEAAEWSPRPGHQAVVFQNRIVLFGGFGSSTDPENPFAPANPMDMWESKDGASWSQFSDSPWNAATPAEIKYDFAALVEPGGKGGSKPSIFTFGGDRETFDFSDPTNYLNVDNDVWQFHMPRPHPSPRPNDVAVGAAPSETRLHDNDPNPFNPTTTIAFDLAEAVRVSLRIYDVSGRLVTTLVDGEMSADRHSVIWNGRNSRGATVSSGVYFYRLTAGDFMQVKKMLLIK
jgi:hypothetical protein